MAVKDFGGGVPLSEQCVADGCKGSSAYSQLCLGHLPDKFLQEHLERLKAAAPDQRTLDLRGVTVSQDLWQEIGAFLTRLETVENLLLSNAVFEGEFDLHGLTVTDALAADGVEFGGASRIRGCRFRHAFFMGSEFTGVARFGNVVFEETCSFRECTFGDTLFAGEDEADFVIPRIGDFAGASLRASAIFKVQNARAILDFSGGTWQGDALLEDIEVEALVLSHRMLAGDLVLTKAKIWKTLSLYKARIEGYCDFDRAWTKHLDLRQAHVVRAPELGEVRVEGWAVLDQAIFEQQVRLRVEAEVIHCHRTIFQSGVSMSLAGDLIADGAFFPPPSDISGVTSRLVEGQPRILSLRRADVVGLSISDVDLSACLFAGIHHLEHSRLGAGLRFGGPPGKWRSPRDLLAEEQWLRSGANTPHDWRGNHSLLPPWFEGGQEGPSSILPVDRPVRPEASSVAETYRSLRKAREEGKDSPGAAAFYYGEMEMRRQAIKGAGIRDWSELLILNVYWLFSGYGLRAWRSLFTLALVIAISSYLLWKWGFREPETFRHAARVAMASATSLLRPVDDSELNGTGFAFEILLRFLGPILLALSALALRARVKR